MLLAVAGLILTIISHEMDNRCMSENPKCEDDVDPKIKNAMESGRFNQAHTNYFRTMTLALSLAAIVCIVWR